MDIYVNSMNTGNHMNYIIMHPKLCSELPLMIFLHGAGERGKNVEHLYRHGIPRIIKEGKEIPAVVLCPQCPERLVWNSVVQDVKQLIDQTVDDYYISKEKICITGSSMGGFGTWEMIATYGNLFSGAAPVAGGGMSWRASNIRQTPVRAYHGTVDTTVPIVYSELMVNAVNSTGGKASLVCLDGLDHNDGIDKAYRDTDLIQWLLSQHRTNYEYVPECCEEFF